MLINVYKQTYNPIHNTKFLTINQIKSGFTKIKCPDCNGTGLFEVPNGVIGVVYTPNNPAPYIKEMCVTCKGIGKLDVTL